MFIRGLKRWQIKAMIYVMAIAAVPVRYSGTLHPFAQFIVGLFTGNLS